MNESGLPALTGWERHAIWRRRDTGWSIRALAVAYGVSERTVYRVLRSRPSVHHCEAGCLVETPRRLCYFHARDAA